MDKSVPAPQFSDVPMSVEWIGELADRFGGELSHWPVEEAHLARRFLAESSSARAVLARAQRLDRILRKTRAPSVTANMRARLLAAAPVGGWRELLASVWPFGPVWRPAAALLGFAFVGILLGATEAATFVPPVSVNGALSEELQVIAYSSAEFLDEQTLLRR